ncbi:MAG: AAA family ATPase [Brevinematia bacterium]
MYNSSMSILIDYSILLFNKFVKFIDSSGLNSEGVDFSTRVKSKTFVIKSHRIREYIDAIKNFSPVSNISVDEKKLILLLIGASFYEESGINIWQACCFFHKIPSKAIFSLSKMLNVRSKLLKSGILMVQEADLIGTNLSIKDIADFYNNKRVFISPFFINSFFSSITGEEYHLLSFPSSSKYNDVDTLINDISNLMKYIFFLANYHKVNFFSSAHNRKKDPYQKGELIHYISKLKKGIIHSRLNIGLKEFLKENNLSNIEFIIMLYIIYKITVRKETVINNTEEVLEKFAIFPSQIKGILECFRKDGIFFKNGFLTIYEQDNFFEEEDPFDLEYGGVSDFDLTPKDFSPIYISKEKIYSLIFDIKKNQAALTIDENNEKSQDKREAQLGYEGSTDRGLYEIIIPNVKIDNVILDERVKEELLGAVDLTRAAEIMKNWGIKPNLAATSFGSIKILLYGVSGTGKTITAQALAGEAGAELFKVDASNLVSAWVGESTKNVKKVFREFYNYQRNSGKKVFLFMNEADQLLSSRGTIMQAADKEYNQMQNILLEELENFEGVFIATTNLPDIFDTAWNRRFNLKIRFDIPAYETRLKLWKVHISDKLPLGEDVNLEKLAEYELAGGSIANIIYNAARKAALRKESERYVKQSDFIEAIQQELKSHLGAKSPKVGF